MNDEKKYQSPEPDKGDVAHAVVRTALSTIPVVGGPAVELFAAIVTPPLERRRQEWMQEVGEALHKLEEDRKIKLDDLQNNPAFIDTILHASQVALRNSQEDKRQALRNAVLNAALPDPPEEAIQQIFIDLVDTCTAWHLRILKLFQAPSLWLEAHGLQLRGNSLALVLEAALPELRGRRSFYDQIWRDLHTRGLVTIEGLHGMMTGQGLTQKRTTDMGEQFLRFIEEPL
jgi:hypothetical protein